MRPVSTPNTTTSSLAPASSSISTQGSPWHSPVPYLFGGLAAMLGLIAFALLILACSYWRFSSQLRNQEGSDRDLESGGGEKEADSAKKESVKVYEEKILVIMAGDEKPTFLATPVCTKPSPFDDGIGNNDNKQVENNENCEKSEKEMDTHVHVEAITPIANEGIQETQQQNQ